jgi:hypothetical protein
MRGNAARFGRLDTLVYGRQLPFLHGHKVAYRLLDDP